MQQIACTLSAADHLGQRQAELGRAHRAGERHQHLAAAVEVRDVAVGGVDQRRGVEVAVVVPDEIARSRPSTDPRASRARPSKRGRLGNRAPRHNHAARELHGRRGHSGHLLREAVERAEAGDEHAAVDGHDAPAREAARDDRARGVVLRAAEHGHEHGAVRDVEVRVARGQALVLEVLRLRHRQLDDLERTAREPERRRAGGDSPRAARGSDRAGSAP